MTDVVRRPARPGPAVSLILAIAWLPALAFAARDAAAESWPLARVLAAARAHDPALRAAHAAGDAGRAQAAMNWALLSPHVTLSGGFTRSDDPAMLFSQKLWQGRFTPADFAIGALNQPAPASALQWSLTLEQPLWNGGREVLAPGLAGHYRKAATSMERAAVADRVLAVVEAWVDAVRARDNAKAAAQALEFADHLRAAAAQRWRMGQVAEVDTLRAAARAAEARVRWLGAEQQRTVVIDRLSRLAGAEITPDELDDTGVPDPAPTPGAGGRGELAAAREGAAAAATQARESALALLPTLNSRLALTQYKPAGSLAGGYEQRWMVAIAADLPLFDGAQRLNAWRAARAQAEQSKAAVQALERDMAVGLAGARAEAAVSIERREAARAGRAAAEEALRLADSRYRAGLLPLTDLLAADAEATAARAMETEATTAVTLAHYRLLHAMGDLR
jgi:outer membrane protein TolC